MMLQEVAPCVSNVQKPRESAPEEWIALDNGGFAKVRRSSMMSFMKRLVLKSRNWLNVRWSEPLCNYQEAPTYADDDASVPIDEVQDPSKSANILRSSSNVEEEPYVDPTCGTELHDADHATGIGITEEFIVTMFYHKSGLKMKLHMEHELEEAFICDSNVDQELDKCCVCNNVEAPKRQKGESGETIVTRWIGCNNCPNWFHSTCLTEKVDEDTFVCNFCTPDIDAGALPENPTFPIKDKMEIDPPAPTVKNEFFNCKDCVVDSTEFVYCWCKSKYRHRQCHTTSNQGFLCSASCRSHPGGKNVSNFRCSVCRSTDTTDLLRCFKCNYTICHRDCVPEDSFVVGSPNLFVCDECE